MRALATIKAELGEARAAYQAIANTGTAAEQHELSQRVKALQAEVSTTIAAGASQCPRCGSTPHGIEHQVARGRAVGIEYEVGCLACPPFVHADGTTRRPAARGGTLPRHAVDAWNAGPDHWLEWSADR